MLGIVVDIILVVVILFLFYCLSALWPPDSPWAPWWQTPKEKIRKMYRLAKLTKKDIVYDLGCGTGDAIIIAAKEYGAHAVGIEIDPLRFVIAKWRVSTQRVKKAQVIKKNFFAINFSPATIVVMYLVPNALERLVPKFLKEIQPGTKFISYRYEMPIKLFKGRLKLIGHDRKNELFVYALKN